MQDLKFSFEYFCSPIWIRDNEESAFANVLIEDLPIDRELMSEINKLDDIYQATYNDEYPPEPLPFEDEQGFRRAVKESFNRLSSQLSTKYSLVLQG